jgi:hypothetical protein
MATKTRVQISFPNEGFNVNLIQDSNSNTYRYFYIQEKYISRNDAEQILDYLKNNLGRYFKGIPILKEKISSGIKYFIFTFYLQKSNIKDERWIMDVMGKILKNKVSPSTTSTTPDPTPTPDPINQTSSSEFAPDDTIFAVNIIEKRIEFVIDRYDTQNRWILSNDDKQYIVDRKDFFVKGDVVELNATDIGSVFYLVEDISSDSLYLRLGNSVDYTKGFSTNIEEVKIKTFFSSGDTITIVQYYNLIEKFDEPTLVPKTEEPTITQVSPMQEGIDQIKKDIGQLLFLRTLISPIEFEEKISIGQTIDQKQKELNELTFKSVEDKFKGNSFFDELFEQSFTTIKHEYDGVYAENKEETNFFTPNGSRSDLSDALNEIIRTPEFINWFGDWQLSFLYKEADALEIECSKVLTDNFEPRIVWHGTGQEFSYFRFDTFPAAYFAVNREYSQFFADLQGGGNGYVIPFFLNVRNPLDLTHFGTRNIPKKDFFDYLFLTTGLTMEQLEVNPLFLSDNVPDLETWIYIRRNPKMLKKISESRLYDGIHFYESNPNQPDTSSKSHKTEAYIIFDANQCKIASPNRGLLLLASLKSFLLEKGGKI